MAAELSLATVWETLDIGCPWWSFGRSWPAHGTNGWRTLPCLLVLIPREGEYRLRLAGDPQAWRCGPGQALVLPPWTRHDIRFPRPGQLAGAHLGVTLAAGIDPFAAWAVPPILDAAAGAELSGCIGRLAAAQAAEAGLLAATERRAARAAILLAVLRRAAPRAAVRMPRWPGAGWGQVAALLSAPPARLAVSELVGASGLSRAQFHRRFRSEFGTSPRSWLRRRRAARAQQLLLERGRPLADIAEELGYCDAFHFSRRFREDAGVSPSEYRQRLFEGCAAPAEPRPG